MPCIFSYDFCYDRVVGQRPQVFVRRKEKKSLAQKSSRERALGGGRTPPPFPKAMWFKTFGAPGQAARRAESQLKEPYSTYETTSEAT